MTIFESMITDLFISMNLLRIGFSHKQYRVKATDYDIYTLQAFKKDTEFENNQCLDDMIITLKRANLIVAEHIVLSQRNNISNTSDTRQILNCSLRESQLQFERFRIPRTSILNSSQIRRRLILTLGDLEGELPMHAESIHEVIFSKFKSLKKKVLGCFKTWSSIERTTSSNCWTNSVCCYRRQIF